MRNILVTGGAGNVGSALVAALIKDADTKVVVVDNLITGDLIKLPTGADSNLKFIKADVNNCQEISSVFDSYNFSNVFHYAALVGVKRTLDNPVKVLQDIDGIKNILELSKKSGVDRVFYSSSSEVYGEPVEFPQNEYTTPLNSRLPYAIVKNLGEAYLNSYQKEFGLDFSIFRFFNTYGPKQSTDFVVPKFLKLALENKDITIYGKGDQTRTFCYIDDNIDTTLKCLNENLCRNDVMNVGSEIEISMLDLATLIVEMTNSKSNIVFLPPLKEGDMTRRKPDNAKMKDILNRPMITLKEGIRKLLEA